MYCGRWSIGSSVSLQNKNEKKNVNNTKISKEGVFAHTLSPMGLVANKSILVSFEQGVDFSRGIQIKIKKLTLILSESTKKWPGHENKSQTGR
jgi:hypothetical protein